MPQLIVSKSDYNGNHDPLWRPQQGFISIPIHNANGHCGTEQGTSSVVVKGKYCFCYRHFFPLLLLVLIMTLCLYCDYVRYRKANAFLTDKPEISFYALMDIPYDVYSTESGLWQRSTEINESKFQDYHKYWLTNKGNNFSYGHAGGNHIFREVIKVQVNSEESSVKVLVLGVKDGRTGGFLHDFIFNQTAIVDPITDRCFIMPLDRNITSSPEKFVEMGIKMAANHFDINVERTVRLLQIESFDKPNKKLVSPLLQDTCYKFQSYMVEEYKPDEDQNDVEPISKAGKFAEFFGNGYVEFDVVNIEAVDEWEKEPYIF